MNNNEKIISLFDLKKIYYQNEKEIYESHELTNENSKERPIPKEFNLPKFLIEINQIRPRINGVENLTPYGRTYCKAGSMHYYRGENSKYPTSLPSFLRNLNDLKINDSKIIKAYDLVNQLRVSEFSRLICNFDIVQKWRYICNGDIFFEPLAQHYGIETRHLDITDDFKVALFFACCYWDNNKDCFLPLTKKQTEVSEERKYGVIYLKEKRFHNNDLILKGVNNFIIGAIPIGYQPFYRCINQNGFTIKMTEYTSLENDYHFKKLIFRHNEKLSYWIYKLMDEGKKIYPIEGLNTIKKDILKINQLRQFSNESLNILLDSNPEFKNKNEIIDFLDKYYPEEVEFSDDFEIKISRQQKRRIDKKYKKDIEKERFPFPNKLFMDPRTQNELEGIQNEFFKESNKFD